MIFFLISFLPLREKPWGEFRNPPHGGYIFLYQHFRESRPVSDSLRTFSIARRQCKLRTMTSSSYKGHLSTIPRFLMIRKKPITPLKW